MKLNLRVLEKQKRMIVYAQFIRIFCILLSGDCIDLCFSRRCYSISCSRDCLTASTPFLFSPFILRPGKLNFFKK